MSNRESADVNNITRPDISLLDKKVVTYSKRFWLIALSFVVLLIISTEVLANRIVESNKPDKAFNWQCPKPDKPFGLFCEEQDSSTIEATSRRLLTVESKTQYVNPFWWAVGSCS